MSDSIQSTLFNNHVKMHGNCFRERIENIETLMSYDKDNGSCNYDKRKQLID